MGVDVPAAEAELMALNARIIVLKGKIDDAYYLFCRGATAKPPSMVVPGAHAERHRLQCRRQAILWSLRFLQPTEEVTVSCS